MGITELTDAERAQRLDTLCAAVERVCIGYPHTTVLAVAGIVAGGCIKISPEDRRSELLTEFIATLIADVGQAPEVVAH